MDRRLAIVMFASVFLIGSLRSPVFAKHQKGNENVPVYYLSLGTSLAAGVQADPLAFLLFN